MLSLGSVSLYSDFVNTNFSIKEILTDDFRSNIFPKISKFIGSNYSKTLSNKINGKIKISQVLNSDECTEAFDYLLNIFMQSSTSYNDSLFIDFSRSLDVLSELFKYSTYSGTINIVDRFFDAKFFIKFKDDAGSNDIITRYFDKMFATDKIVDIDNTIKEIQEQLPSYTNFPLIIMNPNIALDEKIKAVKSTYRKKDLPKYLKYFKKINDFNEIDAFIEATILQNNRVREKAKNVIYLFKTIFINGDYNDVDLNSKLHAEEFSKKYLHLFFLDDKFINSLATEVLLSTNGYYRNRNFDRFIKYIFSTATLDEILDILGKNTKLNMLYENVISKLEESIEEHNPDNFAFEDKALSVLIKRQIENYSAVSENLSASAFKYINEHIASYPSMKMLLNNYKYIEDYDKASYVYFYGSKDEMKLDFNYIPLDLLKEISFASDRVLNTFGFNYEMITERRNHFSLWSFVHDIENGMDNLLNDLHTIMLNASFEKAEFIIDRIYKRFENDEICSELSESLMNIENTSDKFPGYTASAVKIIRKYMSYGDILYKYAAQTDAKYLDRLNTLKNNIDSVLDAISIICDIH